MFYFITACLLIAVLIESAILLFGKEKTKEFLASMVEGQDANRIDFNYILYETEAMDFVRYLKEFFRVATLTGYEVDSTGWAKIVYAVEEWKISDRDAIKKAIGIELHSYLLSNHYVNSWYYYMPVLTDNILIIRMAASLKAQKEFQNLDFSKENRKNLPLTEE